ncbi:hypothetical protein [Klebsiella pneumoniae]|uniref:hypothetical protein n=1 Tax=Klebsiella pneumoniae TaxID=573 RepID=UPI0013D26705|nr:hypothetical protein [Klebsiella pneumoniae]
MEKISFLYVSEILPGKAVNDVHRPLPWVTKEVLPASSSFDVTFGLILKLGSPYKVEIDILYDDKSLLDNGDDSINTNPMISFANKNDDYVSIENMSLRNVKLIGYGLHKVVATLHTTTDFISDENLLDRHVSYFFVSQDWTR